MRWRATACYAGINSRTEGQRAPDKGTSSAARDVKRAQVGLRSLGYVYRCDRTRCSSLSFFERYSLASARSRKRVRRETNAAERRRR